MGHVFRILNVVVFRHFYFLKFAIGFYTPNILKHGNSKFCLTNSNSID